MSNSNLAVKPTKEEFRRFVRLQKSGRMNMLDSHVRETAKISKEVHVYIITNYVDLVNEYKISMSNI